MEFAQDWDDRAKFINQQFEKISKSYWTTKIPFVLIFENYPLLYCLPKEWWIMTTYFCFSALRPLKTVFWILELKKCLKKLGLDGENHSKSQQRTDQRVLVVTLKFLVLKNVFSPIENTSQNCFDFCLPLFYATFQCRP